MFVEQLMAWPGSEYEEVRKGGLKRANWFGKVQANSFFLGGGG